jgi:hypothetical protein
VLSRLKAHATYANSMATIAVMIALGGTSYAALTLPRNSVGEHQIRPGAVRSPEVKNGSLGAGDLSAKARAALRGAAGPTGPQGPTGAAATPYFAVVSGAGERLAGNASGVVSTGAGGYRVAFSRSLAGCAANATLGSNDGSAVVAGRITVTISTGEAGVNTFAADGSPANLPFHLIVAC